MYRDFHTCQENPIIAINKTKERSPRFFLSRHYGLPLVFILRGKSITTIRLSFCLIIRSISNDLSVEQSFTQIISILCNVWEINESKHFPNVFFHIKYRDNNANRRNILVHLYLFLRKEFFNLRYYIFLLFISQCRIHWQTQTMLIIFLHHRLISFFYFLTAYNRGQMQRDIMNLRINIILMQIILITLIYPPLGL